MSIPFFSSLRPTPYLFKLLGGAAGLGLLVGLARTFGAGGNVIAVISGLWFGLFTILCVMAVYDAIKKIKPDELLVTRALPSSFALNRPQKIKVTLENRSARQIHASLTDVIPNQFESSAFPMVQTIDANHQGVYAYTVVPKHRGLATFEPAYILVESRFGLWQFLLRLGNQDESKVYPDFSAVSNSFIFGVEQAMRNMGAHIAKRKGEGMEFNQLREFREGDNLKQIDWKATARLDTPISREYQEEKDQNVIFLLDCSRRMRAMEQNLSYFDYALNALLMSSYIALDKGDAVGVMTFSGEPSWMPPIKGKASINHLLNHLYALTTSTESSDYVEAAENLLLKHHKRSLVILLTNVRDEDNDDLHKAVEILSKHHLVMVVALQERILSQVNQMPVPTQTDLMQYAGVKHFEHARKKMLARLKARGVSVVDATHENIHVKLVSEYLLLKQYGRI